MSNWVGKFYTDRITMTPPTLNNAACVIFLVSGDDKALPLKAVLEGNYEPEQLPAQLIRPSHRRLLWLVDLMLFYEYFHGDNGRGCGASHQTGWTTLVAKLIQQSGELFAAESPLSGMRAAQPRHGHTSGHSRVSQ